MNNAIIERIGNGYFFAKFYIISKGYSSEIDWQEEVDLNSLTEQRFIQEYTWVTLASGLSDKVVKKIFPIIKSMMFDFKSVKLILEHKEECYSKVISVFRHAGKINAIFYVFELIRKYSFGQLKSKIKEEGVEFLKTLPYMGVATSFHLAKNIGINVVKPDRHLLRISAALGYSSPVELCNEISKRTNEKESVIDLVLWRYATIDQNYLTKINRLISH